MITNFSKDLITKAYLQAGKTVCVYVPSEARAEEVRKRVDPGDEYRDLLSVVVLGEVRGQYEPPLIVIDEYVPTLAEEYDYEGIEREFGYDGDALP